MYVNNNVVILLIVSISHIGNAIFGFGNQCLYTIQMSPMEQVIYKGCQQPLPGLAQKAVRHVTGSKSECVNEILKIVKQRCDDIDQITFQNVSFFFFLHFKKVNLLSSVGFNFNAIFLFMWKMFYKFKMKNKLIKTE